MWSGIGLAATYAGGATPAALEDLRAAGRGYARQLGQGAAFAAAARERAGNPTAHTELGCRVLTGRSADLPPDGAVPRYEHWRARIRDSLA